MPSEETLSSSKSLRKYTVSPSFHSSLTSPLYDADMGSSTTGFNQICMLYKYVSKVSKYQTYMHTEMKLKMQKATFVNSLELTIYVA